MRAMCCRTHGKVAVCLRLSVEILHITIWTYVCYKILVCMAPNINLNHIDSFLGVDFVGCLAVWFFVAVYFIYSYWNLL